MSGREEILQSIDALEARRSALGDAVVDTAIAALRQQLADLAHTPTEEQKRRQASILFMDVVGSTTLLQDLEPDENLAIMDNTLTKMTVPSSRRTTSAC